MRVHVNLTPLHQCCIAGARENATRFLAKNWVPGFRMGWVAESATRNIALKRDVVSLMGLNRKVHPGLRRQNGMHFPQGKIAVAA